MKQQLSFLPSASAGVASAFAWLCLSTLPLLAQQVKIFRDVQHDVSPPLRSMAFEPPAAAAPADDPERLEEAPVTNARVAWQADPVVQEMAGVRLGTTPGMNLLGLGTGFTGPQGSYLFVLPPPDPNASVGATQMVETVNLSFAVFDKTTGSPTLGPIAIASLWKGFNTQCSGKVLADPIVLYDKQAGRWLIRIVTLGNPYYTCFAVSTTSDATGTYNRYAFQQPGQGIDTGQKLGVWTDGYYMSQWIVPSTAYIGPQACALDRTQMIAGQTATMQCFQINNTKIFGMLPADLDGATPPPAGSPNYFLIQGPAGSKSLYMYKFHVDFTTPANSTFTGPVTINVASYTPASADGVVSIPQPGTTQLLDANGSDLMPRLAYRNFPTASVADSDGCRSAFQSDVDHDSEVMPISVPI